ncbi:hypothetical protein BDN72DRAFT_781102 [Pluteus cervinus]|uniref:Uncharacterized protein n=1 Tax=Pluteus cervinus TaxID=181527 RepID=A0ACD3A0J6_9AGAR|nr:hypothetical protein BDN72DRAFT_781102 [Pluteus cervinus]
MCSLTSHKPRVRRKDLRTRRERNQADHASWKFQLTVLTDSLLAFTASNADSSSPSAAESTDDDIIYRFEITTIGVRGTVFLSLPDFFFTPPNPEYQANRKIPQQHDEVANDNELPNVSLLREGLLGCTPTQPRLAFTLELLELYHQIRRRQSSFSIQAMTKVICSIHNITYSTTLRKNFSDAFDIYLELVRGVKSRVDASLGRDEEWRARHACPPCSWKCPNEPELIPARLHAIDGNNSLKRVKGSGRADERIFHSQYLIPNEYVDRFKDEVRSTQPPKAQKQPIKLDKAEGSCADTWQAANAVSEDTVKVFEQTGVFLCACRHGIVEFIAEMRKSGELAKYGLAVVSKLLEMYGAHQCTGYDIGCHFQQTVANSSLGKRAQELDLTFLVDLFHGHAHNRPCQLKNLPLYKTGVGLEDFGTCERIFSASNSAARLVRYSSHYHWLQFIDLHYSQWDEDRYQDLSKFILDNYTQALSIIKTYTPKVEALKVLLNIQDEDFIRWNKEEEEYLTRLSRKVKHDAQLILAEYSTVMQDPFIHNYTPADFREHGVLSPQARKTAQATAKEREKLRNALQLTRDRVSDAERVLGIEDRWTTDHASYQELQLYIRNSKWVEVVEKLEGLVVQRLIELSKANLAGTGYKLRRHISYALIRRSAAIKTAIQQYNQLAPLQTPPQPELEYSTVINYSLLGEFTLLKESRDDITSLPWSDFTNREVAAMFFKILRAREELERLNVEIRRLEDWVDHEDNLLLSTAQKLAVTDPSLSHQVNGHYTRRRRANNVHRHVLSKIYAMAGYSGQIPPRHQLRGTLARTKDNEEEEEDGVAGDDHTLEEVSRLDEYIEAIAS